MFTSDRRLIALSNLEKRQNLTANQDARSGLESQSARVRGVMFGGCRISALLWSGALTGYYPKCSPYDTTPLYAAHVTR